MHNMVGAYGESPAEFRARSRAQLAEYADVEIRNLAATGVRGAEGAFVVDLADGGVAEARSVILATGVADDLPPVPGLGELWGTRAFICPFCDGHEHAGRPIAITGDPARAAHLIALLGRIVGEITVFPAGADLSIDDTRMLTDLGADVAAPVESVAATDDGVRIVAGGSTHTVAGIFVAAGSVVHRAPFADQLGVQLLPTGWIEIDDFGRTSVPGVFAAGDLAHRASLPARWHPCCSPQPPVSSPPWASSSRSSAEGPPPFRGARLAAPHARKVASCAPRRRKGCA